MVLVDCHGDVLVGLEVHDLDFVSLDGKDLCLPLVDEGNLDLGADGSDEGLLCTGEDACCLDVCLCGSVLSRLGCLMKKNALTR